MSFRDAASWLSSSSTQTLPELARSASAEASIELLLAHRAGLAAQDDFRGALVRRVDGLDADTVDPDRPGGWYERLEKELARAGFERDAAAELRAAEALALDLLAERAQA